MGREEVKGDREEEETEEEEVKESDTPGPRPAAAGAGTGGRGEEAVDAMVMPSSSFLRECDREADR